MNRTIKLNRTFGFLMIAMLATFFSCKKTTNQELRDDELALRTGYIDRFHKGASAVFRGVYIFPDKDQPKDQLKEEIKDKDVVRVYYEGYLLENSANGVQLKETRFDGNFNYKLGTEKYDPFELTVSDKELYPSSYTKEISGWHIALSNMKVGERAEVVIPSSQGYSYRGSGSIGAYQTLVFFIEVKEKVGDSGKEPVIE
ncbi:FKBP-type peptidyl-prolyl cis-trans isomerase [Halosquirtibacter xylanolyticus]|uniref:FKBP-type peptidyl-prolyl cis-trans isomerase n=1 Tax=Halosquirtibacter xylanolyticus TaxID=3374599 RepID=UPI003747A01F|nr:FKBP-type peptidyl-prolyl cis-trans isomerase [Prolixibacteraceae bacterium]